MAEVRSRVASAAGKVNSTPAELERAVLSCLSHRANYTAEEADRAEAVMKSVRSSRMLPNPKRLETLTRYEAHLGRELSRTMKALRELQSRRNEPSTADRSHPSADSESGNGTGLPIAAVPAAVAANGGAPHGLHAVARAEKCETNSPGLQASPFKGAPYLPASRGPAERSACLALPALVKSALGRDPIRSSHWCIVS